MAARRRGGQTPLKRYVSTGIVTMQDGSARVEDFPIETQEDAEESNLIRRPPHEEAAQMPKDEYLNQIHSRLRDWKRQIPESDEISDLEEKFDHIIHLLVSYQRLGAGAWAEEQAALSSACSDMEQALTRA